jgi:type IV pilus assembly protein PilF
MRNLARLFWFGLILAATLSGCKTTYDTPKVVSLSADGNQVQQTDAKRAAIHLQLGISYFQQDQLATALKELNTAIGIDATLSDSYAVRALVHMQLQENDLAEQDFLKASKLAPNSLDNTNNYGWFLCQTGREKQAMEMFDRVIKDRTYAQPVKALNNAGLCSLKLKDDVAAEGFFSQSIRLDAANPTTNLNLARINYKKQDWTRAQFYISRLIKSESYTPEILWLAIKIGHKLNDQITVDSLSVQLHRRFPDSPEDASSQHGAFNE